MNRKLAVAGLLAAVALVAGPSRVAAQAPLEFNYGYTTADHVNLYVAQDLNLFEKAGLKPKFFTFQSGAPLLAALKSDSLDVLTAGLGFAFALGQKIPLTMLFWNSNDSTGEGLVVDAKSGIKSFNDIGKATKIGAASGTCAQVALYLMAKKVGLDYGKFNVVNIPAPLFRNSFLSSSIDAGIAWSPYSVMLDAEGYKVVSWSLKGRTYALVSHESNTTQRSCMVCHSAMGDRDLTQTPTPLAERIAKPAF